MKARGRTLGLIPAKGGSVRLLRKNLRLLGGRPLIAWAAKALRDSHVIDRLVLSTEDEGVATAAREAGIEVPFMRPDALARDPAGVVDVALHALDALEQAGDRFQTLVIALPTCPFRTADDIRTAAELYSERDAEFLMSVSAYPHTPFAALRLGDDGCVTPWFPEHFGKKSQQMPMAFRPNGAVHVLDVVAFRRTRSYVSQPLIAYVMPEERSIDIDTEEDLREAEIRLALASASPGSGRNP